MIRVLIADDHALVRTGLEQMLGASAEFEVVGSAVDGDEAVRLVTEREPDVALMDLSMPELDGIEAIRRIRATGSVERIVVLTTFSDRERILQALDAGAIGYLLKDAEPEELKAAIRSAAVGDSPLAPKAASALVAERAARRPAESLSDREREVLEISEKTVKAHLASVFRQIGVFDRTQAALWAREHGL